MDADFESGEEWNQAIYLLGFSPSASKSTRAYLIEQLPVLEFYSAGQVDCWFVRIPRSDFEGESAEANLQDINWLSPRVLAHQAAIELLSTELPFFPSQFGTLFSSIERVAELAVTNRSKLLVFFAEDARHIEWGLKISIHWARATESYCRAHPNTIGEAGHSVGANYLLRRKMLQQRNDKVRNWIAPLANQIRSELESLSVRSCERQATDSGLGNEWECYFNLSLLVPQDQETTFKQRVDSIQQEQQGKDGILGIQVSGPWPLYSFVPKLTQVAA